MKRIHYIILTAVLMVLAYCGGQIDTPAPQAQQQPVSAKGPWELHPDGGSFAWRFNTQTGKADYIGHPANLANDRASLKSVPAPGP